MTSHPSKSPPDLADAPVTREPGRSILILLIMSIVAYMVAAVSAFSNALPELVTWGALITEAVLVLFAMIIAAFHYWERKQKHKSNG